MLLAKEKESKDHEAVAKLNTGSCPILPKCHANHKRRHEEHGCSEGPTGEEAQDEEGTQSQL